LDVETVLEKEKEVSRVDSVNLAIPFLSQGETCGGYEIHMGRTFSPAQSAPLLEVVRWNGEPCSYFSGAASPNRLVFGWYAHGFFDSPATRLSLLAWLAARKGLEGSFGREDGNKEDDEVFDRLADVLASHVDLGPFFRSGSPVG